MSTCKSFPTASHIAHDFLALQVAKSFRDYKKKETRERKRKEEPFGVSEQRVTNGLIRGKLLKCLQV